METPNVPYRAPVKRILSEYISLPSLSIATPAWPLETDGHNKRDTKDEITLTVTPAHDGLLAATSSASTSRSSTRKYDRPPPRLRYGSGGTTSVQPTGSDHSVPSGRSNVTRSSPQSGLTMTSRNAWPHNG